GGGDFFRNHASGAGKLGAQLRRGPPVTPLACLVGLALGPTAPLVDLYGDPLPDGAVLRLGTVAFRVPYLADVGFRKTGELVALTGDLTLHVWPADGRGKAIVTAVTGKSEYGWRRGLSPDGRFVVGGRIPGPKIVVWDVSGPQPVEHVTRDVGSPYTLAFS